MALDFGFVAKVFAALFAIINPIANVPVFLSLTDGATDTERRRVAVTAGSAPRSVVSSPSCAMEMIVTSLRNLFPGLVQ